MIMAKLHVFLSYGQMNNYGYRIKSQWDPSNLI